MISNTQGLKHNRKLISVNDVAIKEIIDIFGIADAGDFKVTSKKCFLNLFFENSTRTKLSFERAALNCGFDVLDFNVQSSSILKDETHINTIRTINSLGVDTLTIRAQKSGETSLLSSFVNRGTFVLNAGDGTNEHPSQGLLDLYTIIKQFDIDAKPMCLAGLKIGIMGDILHSRVARSNIFLLSKFGAEITLICPQSFLPLNFANYYNTNFGCKISHNLKSSLKNKLDVLMVLRIQKERVENKSIISFPISQFSVSDESQLNGAYVMHPGPINDGVEISNELAYKSRFSLISKQVEDGVKIRSAILKFLYS